MQGKREAEEEEGKRSEEGEKTAEELLLVGEKFLGEGRYEEAIEIYKEIVRKEPIRPTLAKVCNDCGVAYASLEQYEMAKGFFNAALNLSRYLMDEGISACYNLALLYQTTGEAEKAEQYFKRGEMIKQEHKRRDEEAERVFGAEV
ncbi:MAG TPA: tetratricopeptide repeat protein [Methanomicrobia archaeon]|nr:tetratricopeptide repeat protein [Methanomicrobia archaeon]